MYKKESPSGNKAGPITSNRLQTVESTLRLMREVAEDSAEFYELEPLEVVEVHIDDSKPSFPTKLVLSNDSSIMIRLQSVQMYLSLMS